MRRRSGRSAASRVFLAVVATVVVVAVLTAGLLALDGLRHARAEAARVTQAVAETLTLSTVVQDALGRADPSAATAELQPLAEEVMSAARVDFITVMDPDGIRVTHRNPTQIGDSYLGTIPDAPVSLTEEFTGTLGPSIRTIAPIEHAGEVVGWVSVGVTVGTVAEAILPQVLGALGIGVALATAGVVGALLARRATRRVTGDLPARAIRDTLASAESMRTLGEALRAQTHEHGNRMHTAVALLELGRRTEAIEILTESARQSQALVDQVAARTEGDPTVGALLLGKASQASERGIAWSADIAPDAPHSLLSPIDQVALVGNLIDNALDAAGASAEPRWVRVTMARTPTDEFVLTVSDSGDGVPAELRAQIFERGFSTKPTDAAGRGIGLTLVRDVVEDVGGAIVLDEGTPTTFRIVLPTEAS